MRVDAREKARMRVEYIKKKTRKMKTSKEARVNIRGEYTHKYTHIYEFNINLIRTRIIYTHKYTHKHAYLGATLQVSSSLEGERYYTGRKR